MKRYKILLPAIFLAQLFSAQYMIVGKDSLSLKSYEAENAEGLKSNGIDKTLKGTQDFLLFQQFAKDQKADTLNYFRTAMTQKVLEIREEKFFPTSITEPLLKEYLADSQKEIKVQIFAVAKKLGDFKDYEAIYNQVKSGQITMETAIKSYTDANGDALYLKPGIIQNKIYSEIKGLAPNTYSKFYNEGDAYIFAKVLGSRPSLGYLIFGSISYPNDANAATKRNEIYAAIGAGKKFQDIAQEFGSTDAEKKSAGLVLGSPTLPDAVYDALKGKNSGDYSQPVLMDGKYYVFYIFNKIPYALDEQNHDFLYADMMKSTYRDIAIKRLVNQEKASTKYKELPAFGTIKNSYTAFEKFGNSSANLYQYGNHFVTYGDLKKLLSEDFQDLDKLSPEQWKELMNVLSSGFVLDKYSSDFVDRADVKQELDAYKKNLYSDYIFSYWLKNKLENNPNLLKDFYEKNKANYKTEATAKGRIAVLSDDSLKKDIEKEIKDTKDWESLKKKYEGKLNDKDQILVDFKEGEMPAYADIFNKYNVPFAKGVSATKVGERTLVMAVDEIIPSTQMSFEEAQDDVKDDLREQLLQDLLAQQRAKIKIVVEPAFMKGLEQNFKK